MKVAIAELMKSKGITRYRLSKMTNVTYPAIDKLYKDQVDSIKFDTLEKLCLALDCTPNEILVY